SKPSRLRHTTIALHNRSSSNSASPGRDGAAAGQPRNSNNGRQEGEGSEERERRDAALVVSEGAAGRDDLEGSRRRRRRVELAPGGSSGVRLGGVVQVEGGPPRVDVHDARVDVRVAVDGVRDGALAGRRRRRRRGTLEVGPVVGDATRTSSTSSNCGSIRRTSITTAIVILLLRRLRRRRRRRRIDRHCGENASVRVGAVVVGPVVVQGGHELAADGRAHRVALVAEARDLLQVVVAARWPRRLVALFCKVFVGDLGAHCCSGQVEKGVRRVLVVRRGGELEKAARRKEM
ncbi:hypothetical protein HDK77DRAFT_513910, partial [Phyllosticta capitalensis]